MRRVSVILLLGAMLGSMAVSASGAAPGSPDARKLDRSVYRPAWRSGELLVKFRSGVTKGLRAGVHQRLGARLLQRIRPFGIEHVALGEGASVDEAMASYQADPTVEYAEPNALRYPMESVPTDAGFPDQWAHRNTGQAHVVSDDPGFANLTSATGTVDADMDTADAWVTEQGDPASIIAVIDSGVDVTHPDIAPNLWTNPGEIAANDIDDDGNGYVDDVHGCDVTELDTAPLSTCEDAQLLDAAIYSGYEHGTSVAGVAAADRQDVADLNKKAVGVCPECSIMVLKFMEPVDIDGDGTPDTMAGDLASELLALAYAKAEGAQVVNASFGAPVLWSKSERNAILSAQNQFLMVVAAGNSSVDNDMSYVTVAGAAAPWYPASYTVPNVLAVAATNHKDEYGRTTECVAAGASLATCQFTNWGYESVDVGAPGVDIFSTVPAGAFATFDGTSLAAPQIAGIAGLVEAATPEDTSPLVLKNMIMNSADDVASLGSLVANGKTRTGVFTRTGARVNANQALTGDTADASPVTDGSIAGARRMRGTYATGSLRYPEDVNDVYRKTLAPGRYGLLLVVPKRKDFDLFVWRPGTTEIWQYEAPCFGLASGTCKELRHSFKDRGVDEYVRFRVKKKRTFSFQVGSFFSSGKYLLVIRRIG